MNIIEKFSNLTQKQRELFNTVSDGAGLDTFLSQSGIELTAEEKTAALEFVASGLLPLDDDELDAVAGGCGGSSSVTYATCPKCKSDGTYKIEGNYYASCSACGHVSAAG